ncbi:hypothetical protein HYX01_02755 [Candidatus Woesearchaeota archaeon]|nr:hypothetical protein [Candidatus Woesearchaeota archaeon]
MEVNNKIYLMAALITALLFASIYSFNLFLNNKRENVVIDKMEEVLDEYQEIQTLSLMSSVFGREMSCLSLEKSLAHMDKTLWDTGIKIDRYKQLTEEFTKDPFYIIQKTKFNRNEVLYFSMLKELKDWCSFNQTIILYFYKKKEECSNCDAQSFVLTDLNKEIDSEIAIFSFDTNLELPSINTLVLFYNVTSYPCTVIENKTYCELLDKDSLIEALCGYKNHSICR